MRTGNGFPAKCYAVFKAMRYRDHEKDMFAQVSSLLDSKDYVNPRLTEVAATDYSFAFASGSGAWDIEKWAYAEDFIAASGMPREIFPEALTSTAVLGEFTRERVKRITSRAVFRSRTLKKGPTKTASPFFKSYILSFWFLCQE